MSDIDFNCPNCKKSLVVDEAGAGMAIQCPGCGKEVTIPQSSHPSKPLLKQTVSESSSAECPSCGNSVQQDAVICINCGLNLKTGARVGSSVSAEQACPQCKTGNPLIAKYCIKCGAQLGVNVKLWDPRTAASYSALFTTAFGAWLHAKNWLALGEPAKAKTNMVWFWISLALCAINLILIAIPEYAWIIFATRMAFLILPISWYFITARPQMKFVKIDLHNSFEKKRLLKPLVVGFTCSIGYFAVGMVVFLIAYQPPLADVTGKVKDLIAEEWKKHPDLSNVTLQDATLVHNSGKNYEGFAVAVVDGKNKKIPLIVSVDGNTITWELKPTPEAEASNSESARETQKRADDLLSKLKTQANQLVRSNKTDFSTEFTPESIAGYRTAAEIFSKYTGEFESETVSSRVELARQYEDLGRSLQYFFGEGVQVDSGMSISLLNKVAEAGNSSAMMMLGSWYSVRSFPTFNLTETLKWYQKAADAGEPAAMLMLGYMYYNGNGVTKSHPEAVNWFRKAAEGGNLSGMTRLGLAYLYGEGVSKDAVVGMKWLRQAVEGGNALGMYGLAQAYFDGRGVPQDHAEALKWYQKAADAGDVDALAELKQLGKATPPDSSGNSRQGQTKIQQKQPSRQDQQEDFRVSGKAKAKQGDLDGAIADFTKAIELDPKDADAFFNRGKVKQKKDDLDGAIADLSEAIELNPTNTNAYVIRGFAKGDKGNSDGAIADFTKAIEIDPKFANAYNNRGVAKQRKGDLDGAIADFTKAIELDPKDALAYNKRGMAKQDKGDSDGAIADSTKAIELDPKNTLAYNNRGLAKRNKGDSDGAQADFTKAIELDQKIATIQARTQTPPSTVSAPPAVLPEQQLAKPQQQQLEHPQTNESILGYALAKAPISATQNVTCPFKPLKHGGVYQSAGKTEGGFLIVCQLTNGTNVLAMLPLRDAMGYQLRISELENNQIVVSHPVLDRLDGVELKREVPLEVGHRYDVVRRIDDMLTLVYVVGDLGIPVEIKSTDVEFLSASDYQKKKMAVLEGLRRVAEQKIREELMKNSMHTPSALLSEMFLRYSGELAADTLAERIQLRKEYEEIYSDAMLKKFAEAQQAFDANQKAKGLVAYGGEWMTPEQAQQLKQQQQQQQQQQQEAYEASQKAKGLIKYGGQWLTPEQAQQLKQQQEARYRCPSCAGGGKVYESLIYGTWIAYPQPRRDLGYRVKQCPKCNGTGRLSAPACSQCGGSGIIQENKYMAEVGGMVNVGSHTCQKCNGTGHE